ncbi:MAG: arsenate reductase (glutaredoxin) [Magnetococcales bacterium]|nr:arsenate reductase (glutaredoxin) [Magnetococcales bacterium]|tara:strand:- start:271904 stop:272257 length:354 start_codon:yes stop_codon:yes gene_type:complete
MSAYTIYHNARCSKSRLTLRILRRQDIELDIVRYLETPPSREVLAKALKELGRETMLRKGEDVFRDQIRYRFKNIQDDELIDLMIENPEIIERPLVVAPDGRMAMGRPPENVEKLFA